MNSAPYHHYFLVLITYQSYSARGVPNVAYVAYCLYYNHAIDKVSLSFLMKEYVV